MGCVFRRHKTWWLQYYRHGKKYSESSHSHKKRDAEKLLKEREGDIATGKFRGLNIERVTFSELASDLLNDYRVNGKKSLERATRSVKALTTYFEGFRAVDITTDRITAYILKRQGDGLSNASINRELSALTRMFSLGKRHTPPKVYNIPYVSKLREDGKRKGYFDPVLYEKFKGALPDYLKPVLTVGYFTGMRRTEMLALVKSKVDLVEGKITLLPEDTKTRKGKVVFIAGEAYEVVSRLIMDTANNYPECKLVFHRNGQPIKDFRYSWDKALLAIGEKIHYKCRDCGAIQTFDRVAHKIKKTCPECGSKRIRREDRILHDTRRTFSRGSVRAGTSKNVTKEVTGHVTDSVFDGYDVTIEDDLKLAAERWNAYHKEQVDRYTITTGQLQDGNGENEGIA